MLSFFRRGVIMVRMKRYFFIIPVLIIVALPMLPTRHEIDPDGLGEPCCAPCDQVVEVFPNSESGTDVLLEFKGDEFDHGYGPSTGIHRGRYYYWDEQGGRYLYLYDTAGHLVNRVHNPEWVKRVIER